MISVCPRPDNIPASYTGNVTVKAKFLEEAGKILDTSIDYSRERLQQRFLIIITINIINFIFSARLLSYQPFLNMVLTCIQGEEMDNLISSLLKYIQLFITKTKEVNLFFSN